VALASAAREVIASSYYVLGPQTRAFEEEFATYCGVPHCVGVGNGTDALEIALKAVGVGPGDRVAVAANAAMYGTSAVLAAGAEPVFVDVESSTATMSHDALAEVFASPGRVVAVIVTHLYGRLARIAEIVQLARAAGAAVVEDCAQAHGAVLADGRRAGAIGDVASFSFYPTKNLGAVGDGGAVTTRDPLIAARVAQLRQYGWTSKYCNTLSGGRNSRLDEVQAAMLRVMLPLLDGWNARRREIANRYSRMICHPKIEVPPQSGPEFVAHLYVVRCAERDALRAHLHEQGIQTDIHYPRPDHRQPCHAGRYEAVVLANTERDAEQVLSLPCFPELSEDEITRVIDACNRF
jgi:dTDP-4-amino-4,6-dideoxygalactose transaminase